MRRWFSRRVVLLGVLLLAIGSITTWLLTRERLPRSLRIATAHDTGLYHKLAGAIEERYEARTGRAFERVTSEGSTRNAELLAAGEVDLAIVQGSALTDERLAEVAVIAALYPEVLHVVVRRDGPLQEILDLSGHDVSLGEPGSGMRQSAAVLLEQYRIDPEELGRNDAYFEELRTDPELDGAVVTTGLDNPGLCELLDVGEYRLLPVGDRDAIALSQPTFRAFDVPRGFFDERPPVPAEPVPTIATTAVLVARLDCPDRVVAEVLGALYDRDLRVRFPHLIPEDEVLARSPVPIHPKARQVLDPYADLDRMATFIEGLNGVKELLVGFGALCYLLWDRARRMRDREHEREVAALKDHLDEYLEKTIAIERRQLEVTDSGELRALLRELTHVKLAALDELTHEELRADQSFQIFLLQCANLSRKIQARLSFLQAERASD